MRGEEKGGRTRGARYLIYIVSFSKELTIIEENLFLERSHFRLGEVFYYFLFFFTMTLITYRFLFPLPSNKYFNWSEGSVTFLPF